MRFFSKLKNSIKELTWPTKKKAFNDTMFVVIVATVLSGAIMTWNTIIEMIVSIFI